jgi:transposase
MPRTHGYAPKGDRCNGLRDWNARGRTNVIGALIGTILLTVALITGNINADIFYQWVVQELLPKLPPASVVVMDNASFHKRFDIQSTIKNAGHTLEFLPAYSPDFNPIEKKWAQAKTLRRKLSCSTTDLFKNRSLYVG